MDRLSRRAAMVDRMRIETNRRAAEAEIWDPAKPGKFLAMTGDRLLSRDGESLLVRAVEGHEQQVEPGWLAIVPDGAAPGEVIFAAPGQLGNGALAPWRRAGE
jgi:hypothetical protein